MALVGSLRTWGMIMFSHLKFREAIAAGRIASRGFRMPVAPVANWVVIGFLVLIAVFLGIDGYPRCALCGADLVRDPCPWLPAGPRGGPPPAGLMRHPRGQAARRVARFHTPAPREGPGASLSPRSRGPAEPSLARSQSHPASSRPVLSRLTGAEIRLKLESFQCTGSVKSRGALVKLAGLTSEQRGRGVVAMSAGNHA